jgi:hypothetical protein
MMSYWAVRAGTSRDLFHFFLCMALSCCGAIGFGTASERIGGLMATATTTASFSPLNAKLTLIAAMKAYHDQHSGVSVNELVELAEAAGIPYGNEVTTTHALHIGAGATEFLQKHPYMEPYQGPDDVAAMRVGGPGGKVYTPKDRT